MSDGHKRPRSITPEAGPLTRAERANLHWELAELAKVKAVDLKADTLTSWVEVFTYFYQVLMWRAWMGDLKELKEALTSITGQAMLWAEAVDDLLPKDPGLVALADGRDPT